MNKFFEAVYLIIKALINGLLLMTISFIFIIGQCIKVFRE